MLYYLIKRRGDYLFTKKENEILVKYENRSEIYEEDRMLLDRYASIGFVTFQYDFDEMVEKAKLTESGVKHLRRWWRR